MCGTEANYFNGWFYHYKYGAEGNRLAADNQYFTADY
jgi:hypothetical protein